MNGDGDSLPRFFFTISSQVLLDSETCSAERHGENLDVSGNEVRFK